jgi:spermidine synthase
MDGFATIPPKQKYMSVTDIYEAYGSRGVVAYSCKVADCVPEGGFIIAVSDSQFADNKELKKYQRQLKQKFPGKAPVFYIRAEEAAGGGRLIIIYDDGTGEKKAAPRIEFKKSEAEKSIERVPDEFIAKALSSALKKTE